MTALVALIQHAVHPQTAFDPGLTSTPLNPLLDALDLFRISTYNVGSERVGFLLMPSNQPSGFLLPFVHSLLSKAPGIDPSCRILSEIPTGYKEEGRAGAWVGWLDGGGAMLSWSGRPT